MSDKINVFIDTNIFLSLYDFSTDTLNLFETLVDSLKSEKVKIYLTEQVVNEFWRNRESKIKYGIDEFKKFCTKSQFSNLERSHYKFNELYDALTNFKKIHSEILFFLEEKALSKELPADILIQRLFENSQVIKINDDIIKLAKNRYDVGNPPGKNKSYGDAINWEILINESSLRLKKLYFITNDSDYNSILDKKTINPFLFQEWKNKTRGQIVICNNFSEFFRLSDIHIIVKEEMEKTNLILDLRNSSTFATTRLTISKMSKFTYSHQEKKEILEIALSNNQIYWIGSSINISNFIRKLIKSVHFDSNELEDGGLVDKLLENFDPEKKVVKTELMQFFPF